MTDCSHLWPSPGVDPLNHWGTLAGKLQRESLTRPLIIALRGLTLGENESHDVVSRPGYHDTGVLLVPGPLTSGPFVFRLSTVPYQTHSRASDDGDGDGDGDVATIRPGWYVLTRARTGSDPIWTMATIDGRARIPCSRDLNNNGRIDGNEAERDFTASAILLHKGADGGRSSIGCATAPLESLQVIAKAGPVIDYRLVLASEAARLMAPAGDSDHPEAIA